MTNDGSRFAPPVLLQYYLYETIEFLNYSFFNQHSSFLSASSRKLR